MKLATGYASIVLTMDHAVLSIVVSHDLPKINPLIGTMSRLRGLGLCFPKLELPLIGHGIGEDEVQIRRRGEKSMQEASLPQS